MMPDQTSEKAEVKMYSDFKSPYAYLAFDPGMALGQRFDVRVRWIPFQLRLKGKGERSVYAEYKVKYSYMDARRWAKPRGLWDLVSFTTASREPLSGTLRMGTIPTIGPFLLPRVLPSLRQAYSRLRLYLVEDLTERLIESLHRGSSMWYCSRSPTIVVRGRPSFRLRIPFVVGLPRDHLLAKERRVKPERFRLKDGHCLRDPALAVCRLADRRLTEGFEATSLPTLVQMVDNGLGTTLLPTLAVDAGLLLGTNLVTRPLLTNEAVRKIGLVWRRGTARRNEFRLLAKELMERAKLKSKPAAHQ
jgi:LysR family transcriptional regulator, hydrogen peroxide-inducible genes activator